MSFFGRAQDGSRVATTGVTGGFLTDMLIDISPNSQFHESFSGAVHHPQDEGGGGNIQFYEITSASDEIDIAIDSFVSDFTNPTLTIFTIFGSTDFDVVDRDSSTTIISETSGFDSDVWIVDLSGFSGNLRFTQFDDTQAGVYGYVGLDDRQQ